MGRREDRYLVHPARGPTPAQVVVSDDLVTGEALHDREPVREHAHLPTGRVGRACAATRHFGRRLELVTGAEGTTGHRVSGVRRGWRPAVGVARPVGPSG